MSHGLRCMTDPCPDCQREWDAIDTAKPMCQCGHTRESHGPDFGCWGCTGGPCDAPGVTVKYNEYRDTCRWDLRCAQHGTLRMHGPIDDWEPAPVTAFRIEHAGHVT